MAFKVAAQTGLWSAAATWDSVTNTPTIHASTNLAIDTTARFTATFTAPSTSDACTGVLLFIANVGTGGTVTVTLQESTIDTAATVTLNITDLTALTWIYFRFATPYTFTTTGAGAYRFKVQAASPTGTTNAAQASSGTTYSFIASDNRTGVPASTDDIFICGPNQAALTVTMDGTQSFGSGTLAALAFNTLNRNLGYALHLGSQGKLHWDTSADATLTCKGSVVLSAGCEFAVGTVATPVPSARISKFVFDWGAVASGNFGFFMMPGARFIVQGASKAYYKTKYSSGSGTTADPLITADPVDWSVGDEILIASTGTSSTAYQETETKFIRVKNSSTSYTLADTAGGAESGLTYSHTTDAWILNLQRNAIISSTDAAKGHCAFVRIAVAGDFDMDWARVQYLNGTSGQFWDFFTISGIVPQMDYTVFHTSIGTRTPVKIGTKIPLTYTGLIVTGTGATAAVDSGDGAISFNGGNNKTLTDCFFIKNTAQGFGLSTTFNITLENCVFVSNNTSNVSNVGGVIIKQSRGVFNDCEINANRGRGLMLSNASNSQLVNCFIGSRGNNIIDVDNISDSFNIALFENCLFGSTTFVNNYLNMALGSEVKFHQLNGTENNHIWYLATGTARSSGSGLVDTTTRTVDNLALRIAPEDSTNGVTWDFVIGIDANTAVNIFGFIQRNASFGSDVVTIELFLPGSTEADASTTVDDDTGQWLTFSLVASYTGSVAAFATVRITAKTATAGAYIYVTDLYNGTNTRTSFRAWYNGKPSNDMTAISTDVAAVWTALALNQVVDGTMGKLIVDVLDVTVGSRASQDSVDTLAGYVDTEVAAILEDTGTTLPAQITALNNLSAQQVWEYATRTLSAFGFSVTVDDKTGYSLSSAGIAAIFAHTLKTKAVSGILTNVWAQTVGRFAADDADEPTEIEYYAPDDTLELTHTLTDTTREPS